MEELKEKASKKNQSVEKAFAIIEYLSEKEGPQRLQDIANDLGMNSSTVIRFLSTLHGCGYVDQERDTLKYYLTYKICAVANKVSSKIEINGTLRPFAKEIAAALKESVCLAIEQDMNVVYIEVVPGPDQMIKTMQRIGNLAPMHCTGVGKLLLLNRNERYIDKMIERRGLPKFTDNTITTKEGLMKELEEVRRLDYALDDEECEIGARCISLPVRDFSGDVVAGISVTGPIFRMDEIISDKNIAYLKQVALEASRKLGYEGH
ncbi:IclR family transcriptional regulator [Lachnospiraceae bacterium 62-35]